MSRDKKVLIIGGKASILSDLLVELERLNYEIHITTRQFSDKKAHFAFEYELDVTSRASLTFFLKQIENQRFDLIISSIGATSSLPIEEESLEQIEKKLRLNLTSHIWLLPKLILNLTNDGLLCFIGSSAAEGNSFDIAYSASKAGLRAAISSFSETRFLKNKRVCILEPSLVENSSMYKEMSHANIEKHRQKWHGNLLNNRDITKCIIHAVSNKDFEDTIIALRPIV